MLLLSVAPIGGQIVTEFAHVQVVVVETGGRPVVVGGDVAVWFGELDEPRTEGQLRVRALDPEGVWLAHTHAGIRNPCHRARFISDAPW